MTKIGNVSCHFINELPKYKYHLLQYLNLKKVNLKKLKKIKTTSFWDNLKQWYFGWILPCYFKANLLTLE